jgi:hypothetical protein
MGPVFFALLMALPILGNDPQVPYLIGSRLFWWANLSTVLLYRNDHQYIIP